jgi:hypothetical protein
MTSDYKSRIRAAVEDWHEAARQGKDRPRRKSDFGTEKSAQARVISWLEARGIAVFHPANAGARNPHTAISQGIRAGVPDIIITSPAPPCGGYRMAAIEMKRAHGGTVSMEQMRWIDRHRADGWAVEVCEGAQAAIDWLVSLGYDR